jgi:molybdopterin converting factor small subunit
MATTVRIPSALLKGRLRDEHGAIARFINVFVSGEDGRLLDGLNTTLDGAELSIMPAGAGG